MEVSGITFVGTRTQHRAEMATFVRDLLGLAPAGLEGVDAEVFALPDARRSR